MENILLPNKSLAYYVRLGISLLVVITLVSRPVNGKQSVGIDAPVGGEEAVDKKAVLTRPLNQGIYQFQDDGHVRKFF